MDNLTHSLVGLAAAKAGFERLSPRATALCLIASNLPDADILTLFFGDRWDYLKHHRGITHSIVGTLSLALLLPLTFYFVGYLIARFRARSNTLNLKGLLLASLIVSATHPLMDWTNNYGIRLLLPWNNRWFYGDFVFIADPFLWLIFGSAVFLLTSKSKVQIALWTSLGLLLTYLIVMGPLQRGGLSDPKQLRILWIVALITLFVGYRFRVAARWGSRIAVGSFIVAVLYWGALAYAHQLAVNRAALLAVVVASQNGESITDLAAMPTLANPFRWQSVFETERATYGFNLNLASSAELENLIRYEKPSTPVDILVSEALKDRRAQVFLDFARFPVIQADLNCVNQTLVQFADLRYTEPGRGRGTFSLDVPVECPRQNAQSPE